MDIASASTNKREIVMDDKFKRRLTKNQILSIPNLLSLVRFLLIPVFVVLYCAYDLYLFAAGVVVFSALTDVVDGFIARRFNMVTDLGKFLDPVADKLTQAAMVICVATKHWWIIFLLVLMAIREVLMFLWGYFFFKKNDKVNSAKWYGKVSTVVVFATMFSLFAFPLMPTWLIVSLVFLCGFVVMGSLILYGLFYHKLFREYNNK